MVAEITEAPSWRPLAAWSDDDLAAELRRRGYAVLHRAEPWVLPGLEVGVGGRRAVWRGREVFLSPREGDVLAVLAARWPDAIKAVHLSNAVWGPWGSERLSSVYVRYLRCKLPGLIETRHRGGYRLAVSGDPS